MKSEVRALHSRAITWPLTRVTQVFLDRWSPGEWQVSREQVQTPPTTCPTRAPTHAYLLCPALVTFCSLLFYHSSKSEHLSRCSLIQRCLDRVYKLVSALLTVWFHYWLVYFSLAISKDQAVCLLKHFSNQVLFNEQENAPRSLLWTTMLVLYTFWFIFTFFFFPLLMFWKY